MMKDFQKMGGVAALIQAAAYVVGLGLFLTLQAPYATGDVEPVQQVALLVDNQAIVYIVNLIQYVVAGVFLVVLALALYERLKDGSPAMVQTETAFGLIWAGGVIAAGMVFNIGLGTVVDLYGKDPAQAATVWLAIESVYDGLEGGNVILGSLWTLLVSWAALRAGGLPRALNYLGVVVGVAGLLSVVPALEVVGFAIFGLGGIVWFVWLGIVMLRGSPSAAA
jgi:hypothetical protein